MISIMTKTEYESASLRHTREESDLVFVTELKEGFIDFWMAKNRFGTRKTIQTALEMLEIIRTYMKLVL